MFESHAELTEIGWNKQPKTFDDALRLCESKGILVLFHEGVSEGLHFVRRGVPVIVINKYLSGAWLDFIIWHELGHYLLGHGGGLRYFVKGSLEKAETQANLLAICAIIPEPFLYDIAFSSSEIWNYPKELVKMRIKAAEKHNL